MPAWLHMLTGTTHKHVHAHMHAHTLSQETQRLHEKFLELKNEFSKIAGYKINIKN